MRTRLKLSGRRRELTPVVVFVVACVLVLAAARPSTPATRPATVPPETATSKSAGGGPASARLLAAAREFLAGYLAYLSGQGEADTIRDATPGMARRLALSPPVVPPAARASMPQIVSVTPTGGFGVRAVINAGELASYTLTLQMVRAGGRLLVASVGGGS